jgi:hypothetical protein
LSRWSKKKVWFCNVFETTCTNIPISRGTNASHATGPYSWARSGDTSGLAVSVETCIYWPSASASCGRVWCRPDHFDQLFASVEMLPSFVEHSNHVNRSYCIFFHNFLDREKNGQIFDRSSTFWEAERRLLWLRLSH